MVYREYELGELLLYEQPTAYIVESTDYDEKYSIPVLTAGKSFILGYTNEKDGVFDRLPVIIFDDFTTAIQYVNFPFKVKSSAMKILHINRDLVSPKYIYYRMQIIQFDHSTHKRYWIQEYSKLKVSIPPLLEQERIVARIEELFSQLDAGMETLNKTKAQLAVYRQAVLKEAFSSAHNAATVEIREIVDDIRIGPFGTMLHKSDYIIGGVPVINPQHIKRGKVIPGDSFTITIEKAEILSAYKLKTNDIIMGRRGEMGRAAAVSDVENGWICGTGCIILRLKSIFDAGFYSQLLSSPDVVHYLEDHATGTTMKNLNEEIVKHIPIPYVSIEMQKEITKNMDSKMSVCDSFEKTIDTTLIKANSMRQSILNDAFEGRF